MPLRQLDLNIDEHTEFRELGFPFAWSAHHVKEIVLACLPRGFDLDGSSKLTICVGSRTDDEPVYRQVLGTSRYFVESFDLGAYKQASAERRQELILYLIVEVFRKIGSSHNSDTSVVEEVAAEIKRTNFQMEVTSKKLSRWTPNRKQQLRVLRKLSLELGEAWSVEVTNKSDEGTATLWITERSDYLDRTDQFRKFVWEGDQMVIVDRLGNEQIRVDPTSMTVLRSSKTLSQKPARRYDSVQLDVEPLVQRAITSAGHASKAGNYGEVIALLEPYMDYLPSKQLARLDEARRRKAGK